MNTPHPSITGVLLAGGLGRRMGGGDKPLNQLGGRSLLAHVIDRARPQVHTLVLNVNGDAGRFQGYGLPVVTDVIEGHAGPLAGIHAAMDWAVKTCPDSRWLVSFATDAPFFPAAMVSRLLQAQVENDARIVCARSRQRDHPVFALWSLELVDELYSALVHENLRKIDQWTSRYATVSVAFDEGDDPVDDTVDPFFNINRPEDLIEAEQWVETLESRPRY